MTETQTAPEQAEAAQAEVPVLHLYRIDLKTGEVAHALDSRDYATLCAEILTTRRVLERRSKQAPDPFESPQTLQQAAREQGFLFFQTGMFEVKTVKGFSVDIPPEELERLDRVRAAQLEAIEEIEDDDEEVLR